MVCVCDLSWLATICSVALVDRLCGQKFSCRTYKNPLFTMGVECEISDIMNKIGYYCG